MKAKCKCGESIEVHEGLLELTIKVAGTIDGFYLCLKCAKIKEEEHMLNLKNRLSIESKNYEMKKTHPWE